MKHPFLINPGFIFLLVTIIVHGCGSGRALTEPDIPQPDWVRSRPITPGYYIGIGWARKTANVHQYQQAAKQNALSDLASEISVSISSNSVLHAFESNLGFREDFSSTIQARTQEELAGFEIMDTWEDQGNYWIYYRLSAARHREFTEKRRDDAARLSAGLLANAIESREKGQVRQSIVQLVNSMEAIKNYFDDPLPVEFKGTDIQLGNEIYNQLSYTINQTEIFALHPRIEIKTGESVSPDLLRFTVKNRDTGPVPDFPLIANYSERPVRNNRARTGRDGSAGFDLDAVRSSGPFETFSVTADIEAILSEATTDPMIRRLISRFSLPGATVRFDIVKPVIRLITNEENMGEALVSGTLGESFRKNAAGGGYILGDEMSEADYIVRIEAVTRPGGESGTYKNAVLAGSISAELPDGHIIYHRELEGFRGTHFDLARAGEEAFRQAVRRMESSYFREIDKALKRRSPR